MFGHMKPKVEFFQAIKERYSDNNIKDYLIIGDSLKSDVGFGTNAHIDSCWFNQNHENPDNVHTPTFTISKLRELNKIL
jgi:FMN phosphatase YigB (HAD superfamily)